MLKISIVVISYIQKNSKERCVIQQLKKITFSPKLPQRLKKIFSIIQIVKTKYHCCKDCYYLWKLTDPETVMVIYEELKRCLPFLKHCTMNKIWTSTRQRVIQKLGAENDTHDFLHLTVTRLLSLCSCGNLKLHVGCISIEVKRVQMG